MNYVVEPITLTHAKGFRDALATVVAERRYLALYAAPSLERITAFVRANIERDVSQFVAIVDDAIVGWCDVMPFDIEGFRHCGRLGMGVVADWRRRGVGAALLQATMDKAHTQGLRRIELEVFASNAAACAFYIKHGFELEGCRRAAYWAEDRCEDVLVMAKMHDGPINCSQ